MSLWDTRHALRHFDRRFNHREDGGCRIHLVCDLAAGWYEIARRYGLPR